MYITESFFYTAEINTTLYINYTSVKKKKNAMAVKCKVVPYISCNK